MSLQEDGTTSGVVASVKLTDGCEQRPADVCARKAGAGATRNDARLDNVVMLCERNDGQGAAAKEHQSETIVLALHNEA